MVSLAAALGAVSSANASVGLGKTPVKAALARTDIYAAREARIASTTFTPGPCKLLHRKPWLGYSCEYTIHGRDDQCHDFVTVAVTRTAGGESSAVPKKWTSAPGGAPC